MLSTGSSLIKTFVITKAAEKNDAISQKQE
jgi:hypothetical protein